MQQLQRSSPTMWAMTLVQWNQFIDFCKSTPKWQEIKNQNGHVNLYDMNKHFVIPWTRGTGCSVAVLMNKHTPLEAKVMLSHAWAEDMEECQEALNKHFDDEHIAEDTAVWFCGFGLYQPEDAHGPTIQEQIELQPFTKVIASESVKTTSGRMIAVHTTRADLWERLWCVREVREAMSLDVTITAAMSDAYGETFKKKYSRIVNVGGGHKSALKVAGVTVDTAKAKCRDEDSDMLFEKLFEHCKGGDLQAIDDATSNLRASLVNHLALEVALDAAKSGKPQALVDLVKLGDLEAVDGLHEVADAGGEQARDALFDVLQSIAAANKDHMKHGWYSLCWKDRQSAFQLVITLLQTMAKRQHMQSFSLLEEFDGRPPYGMVGPPDQVRSNLVRMAVENYDKLRGSRAHYDELSGWAERHNKNVDNYRENVDVEAWRCQHAKLSLQALANQGNQHAVEKLITLAKGRDSSAKEALQSLAEQWNRQVLQAIRDVAKEAWASEMLEKCKKSLHSLN
ncbi:unnamed protein product [Prorocentrum cordatum]|uniref:Uncharacterized protein n=1 Tax=Prorocentrum cordatum TaxID=2364126 RepID=A0ABN9Q9B5_9DINO|nr:unnamed protein product [Polarella glacialis]